MIDPSIYLPFSLFCFCQMKNELLLNGGDRASDARTRKMNTLRQKTAREKRGVNALLKRVYEAEVEEKAFAEICRTDRRLRKAKKIEKVSFVLFFPFCYV